MARDTEKIADIFDKFLVNIGNTLKIIWYRQFPVETNVVVDPVLQVIRRELRNF